MPQILTRSRFRLRTLAVVQALVLLVALGAPIAALAAVDSVSPASLAQGATNQPVTITGSGFSSRCSTYSVTFSGSGVTATGISRSSNTVMTANVTVAAGAAVGLRDVTVSGAGGRRCTDFSFLGTNMFTVTAGAVAGPATKLAITSISPASPSLGAAFSVVVQSQDAAGNPANVTSTTAVTLSLNTGTGTIGGTPTGSIANGTSSVTITGVTYSKAETGVRLGATVTSGMSLSAAVSAAFTVVTATATKLAITSVNGGVSPSVGAAFSVVVQAQDAAGNPANVTSATGVTLSRSAGTGTLGGTLTGSIANGTSSVTITGVTYSKAETGVRLAATRTSGMTLTAGISAAFTVIAGTFRKLQVLVPGETAAPNTTTGKTGTPTAQTAGVAFNVIVNAVDANWNVVASTHTVGITSSDAAATLPANASLVAGTKTFSVTLRTAGSRTVTAMDLSDATKTASTSAAITVNVGAFAKLQVLVPGETAAPGTASGKTGTPSTQGVGAPFTITVNAVDANWNVVSSVHTIAITSSDPAATLPASAALVAGTKTFSVTLRTPGSRTVAATDVSDATKTASTSAAITVVSPVAISLTRSRGMITYGESVNLFVQFGTGGGNRAFVLEYTSVGVPWTTIANLTTNASGSAAFNYIPTRTGYVRARFAGATDLGASTSPVYIVGVRQTVSLRPTHTATLAIATGRSIAFRVSVQPLRADLAASRVTFRFYHRAGGHWVLTNERHVLTDMSGVARTTFRFGSTGGSYVMAFADRTPYNSISRFTKREVFLVQ